MRRLSVGERQLAEGVFGEALKLERVRLVPTPFATAVTLGPVIFMPMSAPGDFAAAPLHLQAWLVHELTHVWQFATAPAATLASWARVAASGGYGPGLPGYRYTPDFDWAALNLEQQARVVEHAFLARERAETPARYAGRTPFAGLG